MAAQFFVIDMTVYAAVGFGVVEVVEATADFAAGQFAGNFDDGVGGVGDEGDGFVPSGDGLEDFDDAAAFGLADAVSGRQRMTSSKLHWFCAASISSTWPGFFSNDLAQHDLLFG